MSWGLVAVAGATVVSGAMGSQSADKAADAQSQSAAAGIAEERRQFDITQKQFQPFQEAGVAALAQQQALIGLGGQEAQQAAIAGLEQSAGQKFFRPFSIWSRFSYSSLSSIRKKTAR